MTPRTQLAALFAALFLGALPLGACRSASRAPTPAAPTPAAPTPAVPAPVTPAAAADARAEPAAPGYTLVLIKTGPMSGRLAPEENTRAFQGHFENMERLAKAGQLVVAGPYGEHRHDPGLRGIFVLASADRDEARSWAETDPTTRAGVFVLEYHDLATDAPLAAALARDVAWRAQQEAEGRTPSPGEGARPYVLLTAEHGDLARRELGPLLSSEGGVLLLATLDGTRALALLDAQDLDGARERFGPQLENLGAHVLDEWFASNELARLFE
jgi:uncharacterized protein YciI